MERTNIHIMPNTNDNDRQTIIREQEAHLRNTPFPEERISDPTNEDLQDVVSQHQSSKQLQIDNQPSPDLSPEDTTRRKNNSHKQIKGEMRKAVEKYLAVHKEKVKPSDLASIFSINEKYAAYIIKLYKRNGNLAIKDTKRGRKCKVKKEDLSYLIDCMKENCRITDKELAKKLSDRLNLPKSIHSTSILHYRHKLMPEMDLDKWTVKMVSIRGENANSPENKVKRKEVMRKLKYYHQEMLTLVFIDETHFEFRKNWGRGKAPAGEKALYEGKLLTTTFNAITAISPKGPLLCHVYIKERINSEKFLIFYRELLAMMGDEQCCFFLDNATVHRKEDIISLTEERNQIVLFNVPYSSEANPIENFFGIWKGYVSKESPNANGIEELKSIIINGFQSVSVGCCQNIIRKVTNEIFERIENEEDL